MSATFFPPFPNASNPGGPAFTPRTSLFSFAGSAENTLSTVELVTDFSQFRHLEVDVIGVSPSVAGEYMHMQMLIDGEWRVGSYLSMVYGTTLPAHFENITNTSQAVISPQLQSTDEWFAHYVIPIDLRKIATGKGFVKGGEYPAPRDIMFQSPALDGTLEGVRFHQGGNPQGVNYTIAGTIEVFGVR